MYLVFISTLKDVVLASAAITGAVVAVKGLGTWQRQLKGQSEYELARRILVSLFMYRDAINSVRHPVISGHEMPMPPHERKSGMSREQIQHYGTENAYQARWDKVQSQRTSMYPDLLEAEALWGSDLEVLVKPLFKLERELFITVRHICDLSNPDVDERTKAAIRRIDEKRRDILYDDLGDEPDEYKSDLLSVISKIEQYLKPKLAHEKETKANHNRQRE